MSIYLFFSFFLVVLFSTFFYFYFHTLKQVFLKTSASSISVSFDPPRHLFSQILQKRAVVGKGGGFNQACCPTIATSTPYYFVCLS
jgi:hypothetical protein